MRTKAAYGFGDWGAASAATARSLFWAFYVVSVIGLPVEKAGLIVLAGRVWDSINGPVIGMASDRLRTKWGRRRPFMVAGAVPFGLGFVLVFAEPPFEGENAIVLYYIAALFLFDTAYTMVNAPYIALLPELTDDYDERSSLTGWRIGNSLVATLLTAGLFKLLAESVFADFYDGPDAIRNGYLTSAVIWASICVLSPLVAAANVSEPPILEAPEKVPVLATIRAMWSNVPFRIGAGAYLLTASAVEVVTTVFLWFLIYVAGITGALGSSLVLASALAVAALSMPLTVQLMKRVGKKTAYQLMLLYWMVAQCALAFVPSGQTTLFVCVALLVGVGYGAASAIPWALLADVIEVEEWNTGRRNAGAYAGFLNSFRKLAAAVAIFATTAVLGLAGFLEPDRFAGQLASEVEQPASAIRSLRVLFGPVPVVLLGAAVLLLQRFPLTRERFEELVTKLEERRAESA